VELELKAEGTGAEVRLDAIQFQEVVDAEWHIIQRKLDDCKNSGANIILSRKPIGHVATQYFAHHSIFCAGRVSEADMKQMAKTTGGVVLTSSLVEQGKLESSFSEVALNSSSKRLHDLSTMQY
jgi:T-complex protein 1 subunit eta